MAVQEGSSLDIFPVGCMITRGMSARSHRSIEYANDYFRQRLGLDPATLIGAPLSQLFTPASCIIFDSFMLPMLLHEGHCEEILLEVMAHNGERVPVVVNASAQGGNADVIHWGLFVATQRDRLNDELLVARRTADEANQAKSDFLSSISHELRTPMNAILGFAQLMQRDPSLDIKHQKQVTSVFQAGTHLLGLINELLDLARIESGRLDLSIDAVGLDTAIKGALEIVQPLAAERSIDCRYLPAGEEALWVRADETRLHQVMLNLLSNAIKYNRPDGTVVVAAQPCSPNRIRVSVEDTGQGIAAERLPDLFQPFNRLDARNTAVEGTGIGLTITRRIIEAMGGSIGVDSKVGVGSRFWIELERASPAQPQSPAAQPDAVADGRRLARGGDCGVMRLLYIEDSEVNLELVEMFLQMHGGVELLKARTPQQGIDLALSEQPSLILLDIQMPEMDGYRVLEILQGEPRTAAIPVVAVTANARPADRARGRAAGFRDYLTKPLDFNLFQATIERHMPDRPPDAAE